MNNIIGLLCAVSYNDDTAKYVFQWVYVSAKRYSKKMEWEENEKGI